MKKYKALLANILYFFMASFIPKTITFFMVPLYTYCLSTSDYGVADLITTTVSLIMPIFTLQVQDAVLKFAINNCEERSNVFTVGFIIVNKGAVLLAAISLLLYFMNILDIPWWYFGFIVLHFYFGSINNIFSYFCRGIDKVKLITVSSIVTTIITVSLNLITLLVLKMGLIGYLLSNIAGIVAGDIILFCNAKLWTYITRHRRKKHIDSGMITFSIPMIVSALSWWVNNASDKYILRIFCTTSVVGIYAVSSKIPAILKNLGDVISKAYSILTIKEFNYNDDDGFIGKSYSAISMFSVIACSFLIAVNIYLARILYSKDFFEAWKFVPFLLISIVFNIVSMNCENIFIAIGNTKIISKTALLGAGINTVLNFVLIPFLGAYGAAIATMAGYFSIWATRYYFMKKIVHINNQIAKEAISYCLLIIEAVLALFGNRFTLIELMLTICIMLIYYKEITVSTKGLIKLKRRNL